MRRITPLMLALALTAWGCDDVPTDLSSDGPEGPGDVPGSANIVFTLTSASGGGGPSALLAAGSGGMLRLDEHEDGGNVPRDAVDAIHVIVTGVEVRAEEGGWMALDLVLEEDAEGVPVDLLALDAADVTLAAGELDPGDYVDARLFIADPVIELNQEVCLGDGAPEAVSLCLDEGANDVFIPSSMRTGIKTDARFTIPDTDAVEEVELAFDPDATVRTITYAPGLGAVVVAPVIRATDEDDAGDGGGGDGGNGS